MEQTKSSNAGLITTIKKTIMKLAIPDRFVLAKGPAILNDCSYELDLFLNSTQFSVRLAVFGMLKEMYYET